MAFLAKRLGYGVYGHHIAAPATLSPKKIDFSSSGDNIVIPGIIGKVITVYKLFFVLDAASNITAKDGTTALTGSMALVGNGSLTLDNDGEPWFTTASGNDFVINQSGTAQVSGIAYYTQA